MASRFVSIMPIWQMVNRILTRLEPRSLDAEVLDVERDGGMEGCRAFCASCFPFQINESEGGMKVLGISNRPINWEMSIQSSCSEEIVGTSSELRLKVDIGLQIPLVFRQKE